MTDDKKGRMQLHASPRSIEVFKLAARLRKQTAAEFFESLVWGLAEDFREDFNTGDMAEVLSRAAELVDDLDAREGPND